MATTIDKYKQFADVQNTAKLHELLNIQRKINSGTSIANISKYVNKAIKVYERDLKR